MTNSVGIPLKGRIDIYKKRAEIQPTNSVPLENPNYYRIWDIAVTDMTTMFLGGP